MSTEPEAAIRAANLHKALRDPTRAWVLAQLNDAPAAASDLAARPGIPRQRISYHIEMLVKYECAELLDTIPIRGATKKIFRGTVPVLVMPEDWAKMGLGSRNGWSIKILSEAFDRAQRALEAGTFDKRLDRIAANYKPRLDEEGWAEAFTMLAEIHEKFEHLEEASVARHPDFMDRTPITFSMLLYESPQGRA
ncbi:MAG TPA: helix-turn-helix domain-containing protein [Solirubrobacterales bacterium]|jgi:predicted ArsR family transcriptional regulator|nr:helix-turn-helix domain-containing protein [Solirubrobacterales bacterium]